MSRSSDRRELFKELKAGKLEQVYYLHGPDPYMLDAAIDAWTPWVAPRHEGRRSDLYLFAFGRDHHACLQTAATLFGHMPLPPRYSFGYWYSKYWAYTDHEIVELAQAHRRMDIPLDVMVIDMDWHELGWTGYTWNRDYFPDPEDCLQQLHGLGCQVTLNLHPADGVGPHERCYASMAEAMQVDAASKARILFDCTDPVYMANYFLHLHHPHEDMGVDFWWMDWQQGSHSRMVGLDPLPWLNHLHWQDQLRASNNKRPMYFSRYGGIGAGRRFRTRWPPA